MYDSSSDTVFFPVYTVLLVIGIAYSTCTSGLPVRTSGLPVRTDTDCHKQCIVEARALLCFLALPTVCEPCKILVR